MKLSYVIVTRNRRDSLLQTLGRLEENTHLPRHAWEVIVVDNASDDGAPEAVAKHFRDAKVIGLPENEGMPARNHGFRVARGRYVALLDDDSYPVGRAVPESLAYLDRHAGTAALVARVVLPDGSFEGPALPAVTLGGASVLRKAVLDRVGGFSPEFFRQAEEYDLSFRIHGAGYRVERFEDVLFRHEKVPGGRSGALTHRMDVRNNLIVVERFLPRPLRRVYRDDWARRYGALARHDGHREAAETGLLEARVWARRERAVGRRTLDARALEVIFGFDAQRRAVAAWRDRFGPKRVALADFGKNVYATYRACLLAGLEVVALADDRLAFAGMSYRGVPVLPLGQAVAAGVDGVVLSNINPAQVDARAAEVARAFPGPTLRLWEPRYLERPTNAPKADARAA